MEINIFVGKISGKCLIEDNLENRINIFLEKVEKANCYNIREVLQSTDNGNLIISFLLTYKEEDEKVPSSL